MKSQQLAVFDSSFGAIRRSDSISETTFSSETNTIPPTNFRSRMRRMKSESALLSLEMNIDLLLLQNNGKIANCDFDNDSPDIDTGFDASPDSDSTSDPDISYDPDETDPSPQDPTDIDAETGADETESEPAEIHADDPDPLPQEPTDVPGDADTGEIAADPSGDGDLLPQDPSTDDDTDLTGDIFADFDSSSDESDWSLPPEYYETALQNLEAGAVERRVFVYLSRQDLAESCTARTQSRVLRSSVSLPSQGFLFTASIRSGGR